MRRLNQLPGQPVQTKTSEASSPNYATLEAQRKWKPSDCPRNHLNIGLYRKKGVEFEGRIYELSAQLDRARDQQDASKRYLDAATRKLSMRILQDGNVVCSILSGSGHDYMSQLQFGFETVVIAEACKRVEPASLIPLRCNTTQCILLIWIACLDTFL